VILAGAKSQQQSDLVVQLFDPKLQVSNLIYELEDKLQMVLLHTKIPCCITIVAVLWQSFQGL
jgi:hypothetical protein